MQYEQHNEPRMQLRRRRRRLLAWAMGYAFFVTWVVSSSARCCRGPHLERAVGAVDVVVDDDGVVGLVAAPARRGLHI